MSESTEGLARRIFGIPEELDVELGENAIEMAKRIDALLKEMQLGQAYDVLDRLAQETKDIELASRFSKKRTIGENLGLAVGESRINSHLTEAAYKRNALLIKMIGLREQIKSLSNEIAEALLDREMSQYEH